MTAAFIDPPINQDTINKIQDTNNNLDFVIGICLELVSWNLLFVIFNFPKNRELVKSKNKYQKCPN